MADRLVLFSWKTGENVQFVCKKTKTGKFQKKVQKSKKLQLTKA